MDEGYFSHISVLSAAILRTSGPVLELGAGLGSTLMLHGLCGISNRKLVTIESNVAWLDKFIHLERSWHELKLVDSFIDLPEYSKSWGLVFIDHGISEQRGHSLMALHDVQMVVCHDTCHYFLYNYIPGLNEFKYRWNYKPASTPMTSVVSQIINVSQIFSEAKL